MMFVGGCVSAQRNSGIIPTVENLRARSFLFPSKPSLVKLFKSGEMFVLEEREDLSKHNFGRQRQDHKSSCALQQGLTLTT